MELQYFCPAFREVHVREINLSGGVLF